MSHIDAQTVRHVANLARLELTEAEEAQSVDQLSRILDLVEQLNALNLDSLAGEPPPDLPTVFRPDTVVHDISREQLLENAPHEEDGFFRVPRILEGAES